MLVGIEFAENPFERVAVAVLWRTWNARLAAGVSKGCWQRLRQSSSHIHVQTNHAIVHSESLSAGNSIRGCDNTWRRKWYGPLHKWFKFAFFVAVLCAGKNCKHALAILHAHLENWFVFFSVTFVFSAESSVFTSNLASIDPTKFGLQCMGNRTQLHEPPILSAFAWITIARSARGGGHQQRAHSGRSIAKRSGIYPRVSRLFADRRAMCAKNWNCIVAVPICNGRQTKGTVSAVSNGTWTWNSRQLFDYFAKSWAIISESTIRDNPIGNRIGTTEMGFGQRFGAILEGDW